MKDSTQVPTSSVNRIGELEAIRRFPVNESESESESESEFESESVSESESESESEGSVSVNSSKINDSCINYPYGNN